jgi:Delta7-sterol 5-desaturase
MDVVHEYVNSYLDTTWAGEVLESAGLHHNDFIRAFALFWVLLVLGGVALYFSASGLSYLIIYILFPNQLLDEEDKAVKPGQVRSEIVTSLRGIPTVSALTATMYMVHWAGYGRLYHNVDDYGWPFLVGSIVGFLLFTDCLIFWIHYALHWKPLYERFHRTHHSFKYPTPFAAIAFDPFDGFAQSFPYHLYTLLFPFWNWAYLGMFIFVQVWTISIHDRVSFAGLDGIINGSAHHRGHHFYYRFNYGQYTTLWDRLAGTYRVWNGGKFTASTPRSEEDKEE